MEEHYECEWLQIRGQSEGRGSSRARCLTVCRWAHLCRKIQRWQGMPSCARKCQSRHKIPRCLTRVCVSVCAVFWKGNHDLVGRATIRRRCVCVRAWAWVWVCVSGSQVESDGLSIVCLGRWTDWENDVRDGMGTMTFTDGMDHCQGSPHAGWGR
jgi:hypothetical protein